MWRVTFPAAPPADDFDAWVRRGATSAARDCFADHGHEVTRTGTCWRVTLLGPWQVRCLCGRCPPPPGDRRVFALDLAATTLTGRRVEGPADHDDVLLRALVGRARARWRGTWTTQTEEDDGDDATPR